ncbi:MAG: hypothetical protein WDW38_008350 [Sanguina aurantia]
MHGGLWSGGGTLAAVRMGRCRERAGRKLLGRALLHWADLAAERKAFLTSLRVCLKRQKIAFSLFKNWYWDSFDADVQDTMRRMFQGSHTHAHSYPPQLRAPSARDRGPHGPHPYAPHDPCAQPTHGRASRSGSESDSSDPRASQPQRYLQAQQQQQQQRYQRGGRAGRRTRACCPRAPTGRGGDLRRVCCGRWVGLARQRSRQPRQRSRQPRQRSRQPRQRSRQPRQRSRQPRQRSRLLGGCGPHWVPFRSHVSRRRGRRRRRLGRGGRGRGGGHPERAAPVHAAPSPARHTSMLEALYSPSAGQVTRRHTHDADHTPGRGNGPEQGSQGRQLRSQGDVGSRQQQRRQLAQGAQQQQQQQEQQQQQQEHRRYQAGHAGQRSRDGPETLALGQSRGLQPALSASLQAWGDTESLGSHPHHPRSRGGSGSLVINMQPHSDARQQYTQASEAGSESPRLGSQLHLSPQAQQQQQQQQQLLQRRSKIPLPPSPPEDTLQPRPRLLLLAIGSPPTTGLATPPPPPPVILRCPAPLTRTHPTMRGSTQSATCTAPLPPHAAPPRDLAFERHDMRAGGHHQQPEGWNDRSDRSERSAHRGGSARSHHPGFAPGHPPSASPPSRRSSPSPSTPPPVTTAAVQRRPPTQDAAPAAAHSPSTAPHHRYPPPATSPPQQQPQGAPLWAPSTAFHTPSPGGGGSGTDNGRRVQGSSSGGSGATVIPRWRSVANAAYGHMPDAGAVGSSVGTAKAAAAAAAAAVYAAGGSRYAPMHEEGGSDEGGQGGLGSVDEELYNAIVNAGDVSSLHRESRRNGAGGSGSPPYM